MSNETGDTDTLFAELITVITLLNLIPTCVLTFYKLRSKFCPQPKEVKEPVQAKIGVKTRNRIKKIHINVESLVEQAGLEKASIS